MDNINSIHLLLNYKDQNYKLLKFEKEENLTEDELINIFSNKLFHQILLILTKMKIQKKKFY